MHPKHPLQMLLIRHSVQETNISYIYVYYYKIRSILFLNILFYCSFSPSNYFYFLFFFFLLLAWVKVLILFENRWKESKRKTFSCSWVGQISLTQSSSSITTMKKEQQTSIHMCKYQKSSVILIMLTINTNGVICHIS